MVNTTELKNETLTTEEVSERLKLTSLTIRRMCLDGRIPAAKVGRHWIIRESDLNAYLDERRREQFDRVREDMNLP